MNKKLIIIIDDEEQVLNVLDQLIQKLGYETECFTSVSHALTEISNMSFDLIILDYSIPNEDGPNNIDRLILMKPDSKIILLSGYDTSQMKELLLTGVTSFLQKPVTIEELKNKIDDVLGST